MRKFLVKANLKKPSRHTVRPTVMESINMGLEREFEIFANDVRDAKIRARTRLEKEGYDARLLQRATWTVYRLDYSLKKTEGKNS